MCNAKNHRWNCGCGFGGEGHAGKRALSGGRGPDLFSVPWIPRYYTRPNAHCPVCGASVYFYKLANNGRVYFDEVGAPWPKHPCTDPRAHAWEEGWVPLSQVSVEVAEGSTLRLSASLGGEGLVTFVRDDVFGEVESAATFLAESFIQARAGLAGQFDLALFTPELRSMLVVGYATAAEAESGGDAADTCS